MDVERLREAAIARAVEGDGKASREQRAEAFAGTLASPLFEKVREHAYKVTAEDVTAAKQGASEDEIFELAVCSAFGKSNRQLAAALAAIASAALPREAASPEGDAVSIDEVG